MWQEEKGSLSKEFEFDSFRDAQAFVNKIADHAEEVQHHPEIKWVYNKVSILLTTHDAGNQITEKDRKFSSYIDTLT